MALNGGANGAHGLSYGIDEDTALIVNNKARTATIAGRGGVTVVDTKDARRTGRSITNISTSFLSPGDTIDFASRSFSIAADKGATKGDEYNEFKPLPASGMLTPYGRLKPYLAYSLVDNSTTTSVKSYLYDSRGDGFTLTFTKVDESNGYYRSTDGSKVDYSIAHVRMDVSPSTFHFRKDPRAFSEYQSSRFVVPPIVDRGPIKGHLVMVGDQHAGPDQDQAEDVERLASAMGLRQRVQDQRNGDDGDRHVEPEDCLPRESVDDRAAGRPRGGGYAAVCGPPLRREAAAVR